MLGLNLNTSGALATATTKFQNYITGAAAGTVNNAMNRLGLKIPAEVLGVIGYLFGESANFEPLQNLMFRVNLGNATFDDSCIKAVNIPHPSYAYKRQRQNGGVKSQYVNDRNIGDLNITFYETTKTDISNYYYQWTTLVYNPVTGLYGYPSMYKKNVHISLITPEGNEIIGFECVRCVPISLSSYNMDTSGNALVTPTLTLGLDDVTLTVAGTNFGSFSGINGIVNGLTSAVLGTISNNINGMLGRVFT